MVLASILPNDGSFKESSEYFLNIIAEKYFSTSAYEESKTVISRLRRISLKILNFIKNYMSKNLINQQNIEKHFNNIRKQFLNTYKQVEFPENIQKKKFKEIVLDFLNQNKSIIQDMLLKDDLSLWTKFKRNIITSFKKMNRELKNFLRNLTCITFIHSGKYIKNLLKIGFHKKDAILVDESYYLSLTKKNPIAFITFDKGILNLKEEILEILNEKVYVFSPKEIKNHAK